ncbi:MAG: lysoplasmalogenase family protein [Coriobacteriales bacterium]|nr:lysoplasmalogenase family protein [Coriobacteriales bacterium]
MEGAFPGAPDTGTTASSGASTSTIVEPDDVLVRERDDDEQGEGEDTEKDPEIAARIEREREEMITARSGISLRSTQMILQYYSMYSDGVFLQSATEYNHQLAQMSLCMAVCANRPIPYTSDVVVDPDQFLIEYLKDCGFTNLRTDDYDKTPSLYTVATAIGSKQLVDADGEPFTLVAVGVCGGNYKKEWLSNVTLGSGDRHKGFNSAATMVTDRIFGYLGTNHITGRVKIWIAGFSRAGGISNLTAANLVDSGVFGKENIYAYTFATPRATLKGGPEGYENIYNIVGAMDLIPQAAPAAWGFGHYGTDLVLPGAEFDSNFQSKYAQVQQGFEDFYGGRTVYNPKMNLSLRLLFGMLEELIPDSDHYDTTPQAMVLSVLEDRSPQNVLRVLRQLTLQMKDDDPETKVLKDDILEFIGKLAIGYISYSDEFQDDYNTGSVATRVFHEHIEDLYLMWMQTDLTPEELFSNHDSFTYLFALGNAVITIEDPDTDEGLFRVFPDGSIEELKASVERGCSLFITSYPDDTGELPLLLIALPHDASYRVRWEALADGTFDAITMPVQYAISPTYNTNAMELDVHKGDSGVMYEAHGNEIVVCPEEKVFFTASDIAWNLGLDHVKDGWRVSIMQGIFRVCLLLILLRAIVATINRLGTDDNWQIRFILSSITMIALVESEAAYWLFAATPKYRLYWKALASASVLLYCFSCRKKGSKDFVGIFAALVFCAIGDLAINFWFLPGVLLFGCAHVFLIWLYQRSHPFNRRMWAWWLLLSIGLVIGVVLFTNNFELSVRVGVAVYAPVLLLLLMTSLQQGGNRELGACLLILSDCLLGFYFLHQEWPYVHMVYMALYYLSQLVISRSLIEEHIFSDGGRHLKLRQIFQEFLSRGGEQRTGLDEVADQVGDVLMG